MKSASQRALAVVYGAAEAVRQTEELAALQGGFESFVQLAAEQLVLQVGHEPAAQLSECAACKGDHDDIHTVLVRWIPLQYDTWIRVRLLRMVFLALLSAFVGC